jgi:hypothetical protein
MNWAKAAAGEFQLLVGEAHKQVQRAARPESWQPFSDGSESWSRSRSCQILRGEEVVLEGRGGGLVAGRYGREEGPEEPLRAPVVRVVASAVGYSGQGDVTSTRGGRRCYTADLGSTGLWRRLVAFETRGSGQNRPIRQSETLSQNCPQLKMVTDKLSTDSRLYICICDLHHIPEPISVTRHRYEVIPYPLPVGNRYSRIYPLTRQN